MERFPSPLGFISHVHLVERPQDAFAKGEAKTWTPSQARSSGAAFPDCQFSQVAAAQGFLLVRGATFAACRCPGARRSEPRRLAKPLPRRAKPGKKASASILCSSFCVKMTPILYLFFFMIKQPRLQLLPLILLYRPQQP